MPAVTTPMDLLPSFVEMLVAGPIMAIYAPLFSVFGILGLGF